MTDADRPLTAEEVSVLRDCILSDPALVLDDGEVMEALIAAGDGGGRNVVDLRGALVSRLEARLDQLSRTHRSVIAAAYENLAGTAQVHRASLRLLDETTLPGFLKALLVETPQIVAVDAARLVLETDADPAPEAAGLPRPLALRVVALPQGGVPGYLALGDAPERDGVWLRPTPPEGELIWGDEAGAIRSRSADRPRSRPAPGAAGVWVRGCGAVLARARRRSRRLPRRRGGPRPAAAAAVPVRAPR